MSRECTSRESYDEEAAFFDGEDIDSGSRRSGKRRIWLVRILLVVAALTLVGAAGFVVGSGLIMRTSDAQGSAAAAASSARAAPGSAASAAALAASAATLAATAASATNRTSDHHASTAASSTSVSEVALDADAVEASQGGGDLADGHTLGLGAPPPPASVEARMRDCSRIPGWFRGDEVYKSAVSELEASLGARAGAPPLLFLELGVYLGRSTCVLSWLVEGLPIHIHVIDSWDAVPLVVAHSAEQPEASVLDPSEMPAEEDAVARADDTVHHLIDDSRGVLGEGKGHFLLAWASNVQKYGLYSSVKEVVHASSVAPETLKRCEEYFRIRTHAHLLQLAECQLRSNLNSRRWRRFSRLPLPRPLQARPQGRGDEGMVDEDQTGWEDVRRRRPSPWSQAQAQGNLPAAGCCPLVVRRGALVRDAAGGLEAADRCLACDRIDRSPCVASPNKSP